MTEIYTPIGANVDKVDSTAQFKLGACAYGQDDQEFVYVQANGAIDANDAVQIDENYQAQPISNTTAAAALGDRVGVAKVAFTDNDYGWVCRRGTNVSVNVLANCAANTKLNTTATAGQLDDDGTAGAETIESLYLAAAAGGSAEAVEAMMDYPFIDATL